jgi:hypothetical protein
MNRFAGRGPRLPKVALVSRGLEREPLVTRVAPFRGPQLPVERGKSIAEGRLQLLAINIGDTVDERGCVRRAARSSDPAFPKSSFARPATRS